MAAFSRVVQHVVPPPVTFQPGIDATARLAPTATLGRLVSIQPFAVVEDGVNIGDRTVIGAGSYVGHESQIGSDCFLHPRVTVRERTKVGDRVILHSGVVLGADGFGYEFAEGRHKKIPQVGNVEIGDDVEIGANTTIDRGRFGTTRIGRGTKIDNLVQIGHNCVIGEHCIICGLVGIAGQRDRRQSRDHRGTGWRGRASHHWRQVHDHGASGRDQGRAPRLLHARRAGRAAHEVQTHRAAPSIACPTSPRKFANWNGNSLKCAPASISRRNSAASVCPDWRAVAHPRYRQVVPPVSCCFSRSPVESLRQ